MFLKNKTLRKPIQKYGPVSNQFIIYLILIGAQIALIWSVPYWPTQDGPSHIYNLTILKDLLNGGKEYGNFFEYQVKIFPNLGFHFITYPLLSLFTPIIAERIFLTVYVILLSGSVWFFLRSFNQAIYPYIYFHVPIIFNFPVMMGFYSYSIAVPLLLYAFTLQWLIRYRRLLARFITFTISGMVLFSFHYIVFCLFLVLSAVTIGLADRSVAAKKRILQLSIVMAPCIAIMLLYILQIGGSASQGSWKSMYFNSPGLSVSTGLSHLLVRKLDLFTFSMAYFGRLQLFATGLISYLFCACLYTGLRTYYSPQKERVAERSALVVVVSTIFIIFIIAPFRIGEGSFLNDRLPILIYLFAIPLLKLPDTKKLMKCSFVCLIGAVCFYIFVSGILFFQQSDKIAAFLAGQHAKIEKGSFLVTYRERNPEDYARIDVLLHAISYYAMFNKGVDIGNYEASTSFFPVRFKRHISIPSVGQIEAEPTTIDWFQYPSVRYIFASELKLNKRNEFEKLFELIFEEKQVSIWQRHEKYSNIKNSITSRRHTRILKRR